MYEAWGAFLSRAYKTINVIFILFEVNIEVFCRHDGNSYALCLGFPHFFVHLVK